MAKKKRRKTGYVPEEWKMLGGMRMDDGTIILLIQCWGGHAYMHALTDYPHRDSVFTTCPECKLTSAIINFIPDAEYYIETE